jgi:hypothetical protein
MKTHLGIMTAKWVFVEAEYRSGDSDRKVQPGHPFLPLARMREIDFDQKAPSLRVSVSKAK